MPNQLKILVVEDEEDWIELLTAWLKQAGYELQVVTRGKEAIARITQNLPDCLILDLGLPDLDGMEIAKNIRSIPSLKELPIVVLTSHRKEKVKGLQTGADYYVIKSHDPQELLATLKALFRRKEVDSGLLRRGDLSLNYKKRTVSQNGDLIATLSPKPFDLFYLLVLKSPQPASKKELFEALKEQTEQPELSRAIDMVLNRLKKSIGKEIADRIKSVKGFGYLYLDPNAPAQPPQASLENQ